MKKILIVVCIGALTQLYPENLALKVEVDGILNRLSNLEQKVTLNVALKDGEKNISKILENLKQEVKSKEQGRARELDEKAINDFLKPKTKLERVKDFFEKILKFKKSKYQKDLSRLEYEVKSQIHKISSDIKSDLKNLKFENFDDYKSKIEAIKNTVGDDLIKQTNITKGIDAQLKKMEDVYQTTANIKNKIEELDLGDLFYGNKQLSYEGNETLDKINEFKKFLKSLPAADKETLKGTGLENAIKSFKSKMDTYTEFHEYHNSTSGNDDGFSGGIDDGGSHGADVM